MRLAFLKKHVMKHSTNSVSKSVDSKFSGRKEWGRRACSPTFPPPPSPKPSPVSVIADLWQKSGYDIARPYETFREQSFRASTFQTFLGGWSEEGVPQISPMARTLGDSRSILLYILSIPKVWKRPLPWTIKTSRASLRIFYAIRIVIQNDRQKLKSRLKIVWFTKGNFGWPFFKPEPRANTLISLNENEVD